MCRATIQQPPERRRGTTNVPTPAMTQALERSSTLSINLPAFFMQFNGRVRYNKKNMLSPEFPTRSKSLRNATELRGIVTLLAERERIQREPRNLSLDFPEQLENMKSLIGRVKLAIWQTPTTDFYKKERLYKEVFEEGKLHTPYQEILGSFAIYEKKTPGIFNSDIAEHNEAYEMLEEAIEIHKMESKNPYFRRTTLARRVDIQRWALEYEDNYGQPVTDFFDKDLDEEYDVERRYHLKRNIFLLTHILKSDQFTSE